SALPGGESMRRFIGALVVVGAMAANVPAVDVHIGINVGVPPPPPVVVAAPPQLVIVPHSPVYYAPSVPYNYFYYDGRYYTNHEGAWFYATGSGGPWVYVQHVPPPVLAVPVAYYKVPP